MKLLVLSGRCKRRGAMEISIPRAGLAFISGLVTMATVAFVGGYLLGNQQSAAATSAEVVPDDGFGAAMLADRRSLDDAREQLESNLDAMALRLAELQAHVMRLDAVGERLVQVGKLDSKEFDFGKEPGVGGVQQAGDPALSQTSAELLRNMDQVAAVLDDRERRLRELETLLRNRKLVQEVTVSGKPVEKGWMSSRYGQRTDPFTGKKAWHHGLDFAGREGTRILAAAAGVVIRSGKASGYGNLVEIQHPDGYTTRYAHNKKNLVAVGDLVEKGQPVALMGATGRAHGTHLHFEVRRNGRTLDPREFVRKKG